MLIGTPLHMAKGTTKVRVKVRKTARKPGTKGRQGAVQQFTITKDIYFKEGFNGLVLVDQARFGSSNFLMDEGARGKVFTNWVSINVPRLLNSTAEHIYQKTRWDQFRIAGIKAYAYRWGGGTPAWLGDPGEQLPPGTQVDKAVRRFRIGIDRTGYAYKPANQGAIGEKYTHIECHSVFNEQVALADNLLAQDHFQTAWWQALKHVKKDGLFQYACEKSISASMQPLAQESDWMNSAFAWPGAVGEQVTGIFQPQIYAIEEAPAIACVPSPVGPDHFGRYCFGTMALRVKMDVQYRGVRDRVYNEALAEHQDQ